MRIALVSDIHSNVDALRAVLDHADVQNVDRLYCLGDVVGYNANPAECAELVKERCDLTILGNHDWAVTLGEPTGFNLAAKAGVEYSRRMLEPEHVKFLSGLKPEQHLDFDGTRVDLYHGSPADPLWQYVFPAGATSVFVDLAGRLDDATAHVVALGHTHVPMLLNAHASPAKGWGALPDQFVQPNLDAGRPRPLVLANPGSVGQPRDGDPRAAYAILDTDEVQLEFHRVTYDVAAAARAIRTAGLPDLLAERLFIGR